MDHPAKPLISAYHEGAENILNGRFGDVVTIRAKLIKLNPDFALTFPVVPSVDQLALYLELNELRRSGETDPRAKDNPDGLNFNSIGQV